MKIMLIIAIKGETGDCVVGEAEGVSVANTEGGAVKSSIDCTLPVKVIMPESFRLNG